MTKYYFSVIIVLSSVVFCQSRDNLAIFNLLADSVVYNVNNHIPASERITLNSEMPDYYFSIKGRILSGFKNAGREVSTKDSNSGYIVNVIVDKALTDYSEAFKEKLFGTFKVKRIISLSGSYNIIKDGTVLNSDAINFLNTDTVNYDDIKNLENEALPFTRGKIPSEPLFSSLLEPVIAISAAALTVILFFTVRSK